MAKGVSSAAFATVLEREDLQSWQAGPLRRH